VLVAAVSRVGIVAVVIKGMDNALSEDDDINDEGNSISME
jgi:hypothetical protein